MEGLTWRVAGQGVGAADYLERLFLRGVVYALVIKNEYKLLSYIFLMAADTPL